MDYPKFILSNQKDESISIQRDKILINWLISILNNFSHDLVPSSDITPCIKINKPQVVYIFRVVPGARDSGDFTFLVPLKGPVSAYVPVAKIRQFYLRLIIISALSLT